MIIGKNTNIQHNNNFVNPNSTKGANNPVGSTIPKVDINQTMQHTNVMSKQEMNDRSFMMLQDRLNKGLISIDEFNKLCSKIGKTK